MLKYFIKTLILIIFCNIISQAQDNPPLIYQAFVREDPGIDGGQISILNAQTLEQVGKILITPANPQVITLSKANNLAFVSHSPFITGKKGLTVVDLKQKNVKRLLFEDKKVYGVRLNINNMVWVLVEENSQIVIIDPSTLQTTRTIQLSEPARDVTFSPNGQKAYVSLLNKAVLEVEINNDYRISRTITTLPERNKFQIRPFELELNLEGNKLFVSGQNNVATVDVNTFIIETIPLPIAATSLILKLTPDNKFLYAVEYLGADFAVIDVRTKEVKSFRTPLNVGILTAINISPDGRLAYISGFYGISIFDIEKQSFIANIQTTGMRVQDPFSLGLALSGDFSIGQAPALSTTSPSTGDNIFANQQVQINWQTTVAQQSYALASHKVELSTNGGQSFTTIPGAEELPATAQSFNWTVPNIQSANAQIRVSTVDLGARRAASTTGTFAILQAPPVDNIAPTVSFTSPVGGESFTSGSNLSIAWVSSDNIAVTSQDLSLSTDGGQTFPITIAAGLPGSTQSFSFPIPQSLSTTQARLRLVVRDAAGNTGQSTTANNFTIAQAVDNVAPTVTISQPSSNQRVIAGSPIQVSWTSTDNRAVVSQALLVSLDGGQNFTQVASLGATANSFVLNNINNLNLDFTTPQAVVRITATDQAGNTGQSNSTFIISPTVTMGSYQQKVLTINGIGFMANVGQGQAQNVQIFVNDSLVNVAPTTANNSSIILKGNKKKLNLVKGANTVRVVVNGVMSNSVSFQF